MDCSAKKSEMMKHRFLKAGLPVALSLAGFIFSMITRRRRLNINSSSLEAEENSIENDSLEEFRDQDRFHSLDSTSLSCRGEEEQFIANTCIMGSLVSLQIQDEPDLEEEILGLKCMISALQDREQEFKKSFLRYCDLKAQELVLTKHRNMLVLEIANVEFLRVVEQLDYARLENGVLQVKVKKLLRTTKERSRVLRRRALVLQAREEELLRSKEELEGKTQAIKELEDEIVELKRVVEQLQEEKKGLAEKLEMGQTFASSTLQIQEKEATIGDQNQLLNELEQLQKDRESEAKELIYLQWINECLRHELMRNQEQQRLAQEDKREHDDSLMITEHGESSMATTTINHKKLKLLHKLRRWVKGSKEEHQHKCACRPSVSDGEAEHNDARKSCFSA